MPRRPTARTTTPTAPTSRPFTPAAEPLPSLATTLTNSPYTEEQKLREEVRKLRKRNKELEAELGEYKRTEKLHRRQAQIHEAYGVTSPSQPWPLPAVGADGAAGAENGAEAGASAAMIDVDATVNQRMAEARKTFDAQLAAIKTDLEIKVFEGDRDKLKALDELNAMRSNVNALNSTLEATAREAQEREKALREKERLERVDMLHRQAGRRILNQRLQKGWGAWTAFHEAKTYAMKRLREAANRLRAAEPSQSFYGWLQVNEMERTAAEFKAQNLAKQSIQTQLLHWQAEATELEGAKKTLGERVRELSATVSEMELEHLRQSEELKDVDAFKIRYEKFHQGKIDLIKVRSRPSLAISDLPSPSLTCPCLL